MHLGRFYIGYQAQFLLQKHSAALEQDALGSSGVPIPERTQKTCICGAEEYSSTVELVVLGKWLDLMTINVSSNQKKICDPFLIMALILMSKQMQ